MEIVISASEIAGKIESIITMAKTEVYLISPYVQFDKQEGDQWTSIIRAIKEALNREITVNIYAREDNEKSGAFLKEKFAQFQGKKIKLYLVKKLHAKLYYNKAEALLSSMNMYLHSTKENYEIGCVIKRKDHSDEIEKIDRFIGLLEGEGEPIQFDEDVKKYEEARKKGKEGEVKEVQFTVISRGYKWFKVETSEGFENKILISDAPDLVEDRSYTAKAKLIWNPTPYGFSVQFTNLHDIKEITGYCLACRKPVKADYPLCYDCNASQKTHSLELRFCRRCGKESSGISSQKPLCMACFYKKTKW